MYNKKINTENKIFLIGVSILIPLLNLLFLYYFKYSNQGLYFSEFSLFYIGNLFNLFCTIILIAGLIVIILKKNIKIRPSFIFIYLIILSLLLVLGAVSKIINEVFPKIYILEQPLGRIITVLIFFIYQYIQFVFILLIWSSILNKNGRLIYKAPIASLVLVFLIFIFTFIFINDENPSQPGKNFTKDSADVAVVLGAAVWSENRPSPSLAARVDKAAELFKKGYSKRIQLTGGSAPGEMSESEVALLRLTSEKIEPEKIWVEASTSSTIEQIHFIKRNLIEGKKLKNIIIISDSYHLPRIVQICDFYSVKATVLSSDLELSFQSKIYYRIRESLALLIFWFFGL